MRLGTATSAVVACLSAASVSGQVDADDDAAFRSAFVTANCITCHGPERQKGRFRIDTTPYELTESGSRELWQRVLEYVDDEDMPPLDAPHHPTRSERDRFVASLFSDMAAADETAHVGGTPLRRLNRIELLNTLRDLFGIRGIRLPNTFPEDVTELPFDTMPAGISFSTSHLDACLALATDVADRMLLLPSSGRTRSVSTHVQWDFEKSAWHRRGDLEACYFTGVNVAGWSGAVWDRTFVAPSSGTYEVRVRASAEADRGVDGEPLRLGFYALVPAEYDLPERANRSGLPRVGELEVGRRETGPLTGRVELEQGETIHVFCENRLTQTWPDRGLNRAELARFVMDAKASRAPTIRIESMEIEGPVAPLPRQLDFLGGRPAARDEGYVRSVLLPLAERAYRRPLTDAEQRLLIEPVMVRMADAPTPEDALHYGIRRILCSPGFLYLDARPGLLDEHALASRLSYFLWSSMPDAELFALADAGRLSEPDVLGAQVARMLDDKRSQRFVENFTGQWLSNREMASVMICDVRHLWSELIRYGFIRSTELFFDEVLRRDLPIRTFVDSDFTYANLPMRIAWGFPGEHPDLTRLEDDQLESLVWPEPERLDLTSLAIGVPKDVAGRGGVLGLPGVLAATGDGVESSPILRGVWVLDNLFGTPPPPPPSDVPALVSDTSGATTIREALAAHQSVGSCASCHAEIDPIGFALENYDAVGNWRERYHRETPEGERPVPRPPVDASGVMPDGTRFTGPQDVKRYLLARPEVFTSCLTTKLFEYATGREPSVGDSRVLREIVDAEPDEGYGLRDLIVALVRSEAFRTK